MKFDPKDKSTWPEDCQDVQIRSSETGFTQGTFCASGDNDEPVFGDWNNRVSNAEDADYLAVTGDIEWWPLIKLTRIEAIKILDNATDHNNAFWENATAAFTYDEYGEDMPTVMDVFAALGITKEEYQEATGCDNVDWPKTPITV